MRKTVAHSVCTRLAIVGICALTLTACSDSGSSKSPATNAGDNNETTVPNPLSAAESTVQEPSAQNEPASPGIPPTPAGVVTNTASVPSVPPATSMLGAFEQTVYPLVTEQLSCVICHTEVGPGQPTFAHSDPAQALSELIDSRKVNLESPAESRLYERPKMDRHNCGEVSQCDDWADTMLLAIERWAGLLQPGQTKVSRASLSAEKALDGFASGRRQINLVCDYLSHEGIDNQINDAFCGDEPLQLTGINDLLKALNLEFKNVPDNAADYLQGFTEESIFELEKLNGNGGNPRWAVTGQSASLVRRFSNPANPRVIIFRGSFDNYGDNSPSLEGAPLALGFVRGEQFAEIISSDRNTGELHFFLLAYKRACDLDDSCTNVDRFSVNTEKNWIDYDLYTEVDLRNTILDCLQCHTSGTAEKPGSKKSFLMQENVFPWPHFFTALTNDINKRQMLEDFYATHGDEEQYGGIPGPLIAGSRAAFLQIFLINNGFGDGFDTDKNDYSAVVSGRLLDPEHINDHEKGRIIQPASRFTGQRIFDPHKREKIISAYQAFRGGEQQLPDMTDAFPDDNATRSKLFLQVSDTLDGKDVLIQACTQCHADHLDQNISRAKFNMQHLERMSADELRLAQERINLPVGHLRVMPPSRYRNLLQEQRQRAIGYLQSLINAKHKQ